jgi:hypothetical protein
MYYPFGCEGFVLKLPALQLKVAYAIASDLFFGVAVADRSYQFFDFGILPLNEQVVRLQIVVLLLLKLAAQSLLDVGNLLTQLRLHADNVGPLCSEIFVFEVFRPDFFAVAKHAAPFLQA